MALSDGAELMRSSLGVLSVVGRRKEVRYKRSKRNVNLKKNPFCWLGVLRSFLGSSLVFGKGEIRTVQGKEILIKVLFLSSWFDHYQYCS